VDDQLALGLYFNEEDLPNLRTKVQSGYPAKMCSLLLEMCDDLVRDFVPESECDEMEVKRTTRDLSFWEPHLSYVRRNADVIQKLGLAYLLTGKVEYADLGKRTMLVQAGHGEWHQYHRTHGTIECGEVCKGMATGYDWLYGAMSPEERETIEVALAEKGGRDLAGSLTGTGEGMNPEDGERYAANNFGLVMSGGLGLIGLVLEHKHPDAIGWLDLATTYMRKSILQQYGVDGGIVEASRYWNYSTPFCLFLMEPLRRLKEVDLYDIESFSKTADFPAYVHSTTTEGPRGVVNFADTNFGEPATHGCILLRFASHYRRGEYQYFWNQWFEDALWAGGHHDLVHSIIWYDPTVAPESPSLDCIRRFRTLGWVFIRDGWDPCNTLFVFKSGPFLKGHNHRDRNSFILEAFGERLALDAGSGPYYTDIQRDYYTQSIGHNTLLINGEGQETGDAHITMYEADDRICYLKSDVSNVYPQTESVNRELLAVCGWLFVIRDSVRCAGEANVDWLLHTFGEVEIKEDGFWCRGEKADLRVWMFPNQGTLTKFHVRPGHVDARENASQTLVARLNGDDGSVETTSVLIPVPKGADPPQVRLDGDIIEAISSGQVHRISRSTDQLVLAPQ
jgi:hypothetical protein